MGEGGEIVRLELGENGVDLPGDGVVAFAKILAKFAPRLRGFTCYPDGSRGGQPITPVPYDEAIKHKGAVFEDNSDVACKDGVCGV